MAPSGAPLRPTKADMSAPRQRRYSGLAAPVLIVLYLAVLIAPLALAYAQDLPARHWHDELSSGLALTAFAGLLVEFVLSGRFRTVSGKIGIDATMRMHQLMARSLCVFIAVHPFFYVTPLMHAPLPWDVTGRDTLGLSAQTLVSGIIAWGALVFMVAAAILREQRAGRYETWRLTHGLTALVIALFGVHHTLGAGRYSDHPWLAGFWLALLAIALFTLLWVYVLKPLAQLGQQYALRSVRPIALKTWELVLDAPKGAPDFAAGQFVWLNVGHSPFSLYENPFSIASAPASRDHLAFVIKEAGDFTTSLGQLEPGTRCYVDGPHGSLTIDRFAAPGIGFVAGGVGIAPILSILRQLRHEQDRRPLVLLYGNRVREQIVYEDELREMQNALKLDITFALSEPPPGWKEHVGVLDESLLRQTLARPGAVSWLYCLCGPQPMIESVEKTLLSLGVPSNKIISEQFYYD